LPILLTSFPLGTHHQREQIAAAITAVAKPVPSIWADVKRARINLALN